MTVFADDVVEAISRYMNDDPGQFNLTIVMGHTDSRDFVEARPVTFDEAAATFEATSPAGMRTLVVPWPAAPISERSQVREQLFRLWEEALDQFGPRDTAP